MEVIKQLELAAWAIFIVGAIFVGKIWIKSSIEQAIKHERDVWLEKIKQAHIVTLEKDKRNHDIRMKSALLAELMAEWISIPQDRKRLRQLTNEAFLWLPEELAQELSKILTHDPRGIGYRDFMKKVRSHLLGKDDGLKANDIITFDLTKHELAEIAIKELNARMRVNFPEEEPGTPLNAGSGVVE